jgi:hypothetical protein
MKKKIIYDNIETNYSVTDDGKVFNDITNKELKGTIARNEYKSVQLTINKKLVTCMVHRLVAEAFVENPNLYSMVDHIDRNKMNNNASNLRWVTNKINSGNREQPTQQKKQGEKLKDFDETEWKSIENSLYYINKKGQVFNSKTGRTLVGSSRNGYLRVTINGKIYSIHRLVWENYKGEIPEGMVIDHIDGNRSNNNIENLRCVSQSENIKNSYQSGRNGTVGVIQLDKDGNEIKRYSTIQEAADAMGVTHSAIRSAINRKGTCKKYYWKRIE